MGKPDPWHISRSRQQPFTAAEIARIRRGFDSGERAIDVAREMQASSRNVQKYYADFRKDKKRLPRSEVDARLATVMRKPKKAKNPAPKPLALRPFAVHHSQSQGGAPANRNIPLLEITDRQCKWMDGDPRDSAAGFCGHPQWSGLSYCEYHGRLVYQPETLRRKAA